MTAVDDALPPLVDLDAWATRPQEHEELVAGFVTMTPSESWNNVRAGVLLGRHVEDGTGGALVAGPHLDVVLAEVPATVRRPDVVVAHRGRLSGAGRARPGDVELLAEIVSPGSVETDWVVKRLEYARAGVPAYLVVDLRDEIRRLTLFTGPGPDGYTDVRGGERVTLALGPHRLDVSLDDLVDG